MCVLVTAMSFSSFLSFSVGCPRSDEQEFLLPSHAQFGGQGTEVCPSNSLKQRRGTSAEEEEEEEEGEREEAGGMIE